MASKFLIYFAVFCIRWSCVAEVHTSMDYFLRVVDAERKVIQELKKFISESEIEYSGVRRYVDDFELVLRDHEGYLDQEGAVKNPIGVFQIVKMLTVNWIYVEEVISDPSLADVYEAVAAHRQGLILPELKDLKGAAVALVRLQDVYDLQVTSLARGEILGLRGSVRLSARDCRFIGENAFLIGYFNQSIAWYEHALHLSAKEGFQTITEDEITPFLKQATDALINETDYSVTVQQPHHTETNMDDTNPFRLKRFPTLTKEDRRNYEALCKGQKMRSLQTENNFRCYLTNQKKPYFFLQPVKLEVHNFYPPLFTIHDVISDWEIEFLKNISRSKLLPSTVVSSVRGNLKTSSIRTSQSAWLNGEFEDNKTRAFLDRIDIRIGLLTGLETVGPENAEPLQVVNYGTGGHYNPHHDYIFKHKNASQKSLIPPFQLAKGDRMATFLICLTDVTRGGATVFLRMGVAIQPIKGSAAFWYNLQLNGEAEPWTMHAACPVAYGSKWIANKWVRENNQLFTRPCSLRQFTNPLIYRPLKKGNVL